MKKEQHEKIRTWFNLVAPARQSIRIDGVKYKQLTVRPFNGETTSKCKRSPSWSHGFTHFEVKETGSIGYCGVQFFADNATPVKKTLGH